MEAETELEEINAPLAAVKAKEKKLSFDLNHLLFLLESESHLIKHLKENSYHDQVLRPSRVVDEIGEVDNTLRYPIRGRHTCSELNFQ